MEPTDTVAVACTVDVAVTAFVVKGVAAVTVTYEVLAVTVVVERVIPKQEHALLYCAVPEQGLAYAGTMLA